MVETLNEPKGDCTLSNNCEDHAKQMETVTRVDERTKIMQEEMKEIKLTQKNTDINISEIKVLLVQSNSELKELIQNSGKKYVTYKVLAVIITIISLAVGIKWAI